METWDQCTVFPLPEPVFPSVSLETVSNDNISLCDPGTTTATTPVSARDEKLAIAEIATLAVIFLLALSSNVFMLVAIWRQRQYRPLSRMYFFMLHLSLADVLVAVFNILPQLLWDITYRFLGGDLLCRFVKYGQIMPLYLSTYLLMFMALDRYRAVCSASNNLHWNSLKVAKMMVTSAWVLSLLLAIPQAIIFSEQYINPDGTTTETDCWVRFIEPWGAKAYVTWFVISIFALPLLIIGISYGAISLRLWRYSQEAHRSEEMTRGHKRTIGLPAGAAGAALRPTSQRWRRASRLLGRFFLQRRERATHQRNSCGDLEEDFPATTGHVLVESQSSSSGSKPVAESLPLRESDTASSTSKSSSHGKKIKMEPFPLRRSNSHRITRAKIKTIQLTLLVIISFVVCWAPFCITQLVLVYDPPSNMADLSPIAVIILLLASLNSCTNPWIYLAFSGSLVHQMRMCLGLNLGRSRSGDNDSIGDDERHKHDARVPTAGKPVRFTQRHRPLLHVHAQAPLRVNPGHYVSPRMPDAVDPEAERLQGGTTFREPCTPKFANRDMDLTLRNHGPNPRLRSERTS